MSLTSYRAAPPRVTVVPASPEGLEAKPTQRARAPIGPFQRLPEKATRAKASGCEAYVSTPVPFGKGKRAPFEDFMTGKMPVFSRKFAFRNRPCQGMRNSGGLPARAVGKDRQKTPGGH